MIIHQRQSGVHRELIGKHMVPRGIRNRKKQLIAWTRRVSVGAFGLRFGLFESRVVPRLSTVNVTGPRKELQNYAVYSLSRSFEYTENAL